MYTWKILLKLLSDFLSSTLASLPSSSSFPRYVKSFSVAPSLQRRRRKEEDGDQSQEKRSPTQKKRVDKDEMRQEREMYLEKRRQERDYLQAMLRDNEKRKAEHERDVERERVDDVAA